MYLNQCVATSYFQEQGQREERLVYCECVTAAGTHTHTSISMVQSTADGCLEQRRAYSGVCAYMEFCRVAAS